MRGLPIEDGSCAEEWQDAASSAAQRSMRELLDVLTRSEWRPSAEKGPAMCACGHSHLAHHTENREAGGYCNGECLFQGCRCQEFRDDPYSHIVVPYKFRKWAREFRDGWRSGEEEDGRWNPVTHGNPNGRKAWAEGRVAGRKMRAKKKGGGK